jgi:catechol 2,3-dioxygenase-like lactoylglutathione lyase family enzyme
MTQDSDIYPMPMFVRLSVADVSASTEWYQDVLQFDSVFTMPGLAHIRYRKYADLLLVPTENTAGENPRNQGISVCFNVSNETVGEIADRAREAGATIERGPAKTGHNTTEIAISDPDGNELVFSEPIDTNRSMVDIRCLRQMT